MKSLLQQIQGYIYDFNIREAYHIKKENIKLVINAVETKLFEIKDDLGNIVNVKLTLNNGKLTAFGCSCAHFRAINSCKHIPAVIICYKDELEKVDENAIHNISKKILMDFVEKGKNNIKQKVNVEYEMELLDSYYSRGIHLKIKLGITKLYTLSPKFSNFKRVFNDQEGIINFGKEFTYNPELCYFDNDDEKILDYVLNYNDDNQDLVFFNNVANLLKLFTNKNFKINKEEIISGIQEGAPFLINLSKNNEEYKLNFSYDNLINLTGDYKYILCNNKVCHLDKKYAELIKFLDEINLKTIVFKKDEISTFSKGLLPIIKNDLVINENIDEINFLNTADVKIYLDINQENIVANLKFIYNKKEINYFKISKDVIRDVDFENKVVNDLKSLNFTIDNKKIILQGLDNVVDFLENGLDKLAQEYPVFTSEKLKNVNIIKQTKVKSNFTIGSDNIMHYDFNVQDIDNDELDDLLSDLRKKKKYYRLKNGNIVNLENDELNDLNNLVDDLNIDLKNNDGNIPKYQAIYLDYLKQEKYPSLQTNNLFENFIDNFKKYKNVNLTVDDQVLREYQKNGVKWLYTIYKCDLGGILADEMGLGKTIQSIYLMKQLLKEDSSAKFLVVCPTALVYNWANEFDLYGKELSYKIIHGSNRLKNLDIINENVIVTSYGTLREDILMYENINFKVMFIDEAQNIKNPSAMISKAVKMINANTKYALTGTPLENSITELWSIFDFIMPGFLGSLTKFNLKYHFRDGDDSYMEKITKLKMTTSPFIMRRKKSDVIKELPDKVENNIYIDLGEQQKLLYKKMVEEVKSEVTDIIKTNEFNTSRTKILQLLTRLRQICVDPRLIFDNYHGESVKIENLVEIVKELVSNNHKILIFTSFKSALEIVRSEFDKAGITYYTIDGTVSAKMRKELVDKFNNNDINSFLITIKSGGTGLNLTSADVVIHLDLWWNPQVENQATDRAHRIGQTKVVEVIKLITKGTIEEKILDLQVKKQQLSDDLIENGNINTGGLASLTEDDIKKLLDIEN